MQSKPFFTIVIPTLNEEKYLPLLLEDLVSQTYREFEVILVDGHSDDRTQEVAQSYADKLSIKICSSTVRNVGYQRNLGAKEGTGEYLFFCDADNRLPNYYLEGVHYQLIVRPRELISTQAKSDSTDKKDVLFIDSANIMFQAGSLLKYPLCVFGACLIVQRHVFSTSGGFDTTMQFAEDYHYVRKLVESGIDFVVLKEPRYTVSLRRFRRENTLEFYRKMLPTTLKIILRKEKITSPLEAYPMLGGADLDKQMDNYEGKQSFFELQSALKQVSEAMRERRLMMRDLIRKIKLTYWD